MFIKAGGNFIDTANRYNDGTSEEYVGEFIKADRDHFVVATKYTLYTRKDDDNLRIAEEVMKVAEEIGKTPSQVALNWVRQLPGVIIPVIGAKAHKQLKDNLECLNFTLSQKHLAQLSEASKIDLGFPHEFLSFDTIKNLIYGGTNDK